MVMLRRLNWYLRLMLLVEVDVEHSGTNQRQRILDYLQKYQHGANTMELVKNLDILRPAARISELRSLGYNIISHRRRVSGHDNVAVYILINSTAE
jgi:Helix-turn-helix domain